MTAAVLLIVITVINLILWAVFIIRFKKTFSPDILLSDIKNEVDKLLIEINRTVDRNLMLTENRVKDLKALIEKADKRLALLEKEDDKRRREGRILEKLAPKKNMPISLQKEADPLPAADTGVQLAIDFDAYRARHKEPAEPEIFYTGSGEAEKEIPLRDRALRLYAQGLSADLISRQLKLPVSAVQLIIDTFGE